MKYILSLIALMTLNFGFSQLAIEKSSLSTAGGTATSGTMKMVYTIGEVAVQEVDEKTLHLSEGFIGVDTKEALGIKDYAELEGLNIYPNPVKDNLRITLPGYDGYEIHLFDLTGKQLLNKTIEDENRFVYNMSNFKTGVYILSVVDRKNKKAKTIKIQKL